MREGEGNVKKRAWLALMLALTLGTMPCTALAQGPEEGAPTARRIVAQAPAGTVTGFPQEGPVERLTVESDNRPPQEELVERMPGTLTVLLEGAKASLPVSWYCAGERYEDGDGYYYQFSPRWDESCWPLAEGMDVVRDAPYVAVFVSDAGLSTQSAESVELECYNFFVNKMGLNTAATCGILANIYNECSFKSNNLQGSYEKKLGFTDESYTEAVDNGTYKNFVNDSAGYGLVQFTWWELKRDLLAYAKEKGTSIGDTQTQLEYLQISLGKKRTEALLAIPNTADGAYQAGKYFCDEYERPGLKEQPVIRAKLARDTFWPKYQDALAQAKTGVANALPAPELVSLAQTPTGAVFTWGGVAGAAKYRVYRNEGEGWKKLGNTTALSWTDDSLTSGKTYNYTVRCLNGEGKMVSDCAANGLELTFWAAPVLRSLKNTESGVKLRWDSQGSPGYQVWRKEVGGTWERLLVLSQTSYTDPTAEAGKWYIYTVRCADESGEPISGWIKSKKLLRMAAPAVKKAKNKGKGIQLSWEASPGCSGYWVCRREVNGTWERIAVVKGGKTLRFTDKSVKKRWGVAYDYTVRAFRDDILSGYEDPGVRVCRLAAPKLKSVTKKKNTVTLKWKKTARCQGYEVQLSRGGETQSILVKGAKTLRQQVRDLEPGKYEVRVRAWRKVGEERCCSDWSGVKRWNLS